MKGSGGLGGDRWRSPVSPRGVCTAWHETIALFWPRSPPLLAGFSASLRHQNQDGRGSLVQPHHAGTPVRILRYLHSTGCRAVRGVVQRAQEVSPAIVDQ